jgi:hypothetical protein
MKRAKNWWNGPNFSMYQLGAVLLPYKNDNLNMKALIDAIRKVNNVLNAPEANTAGVSQPPPQNATTPPAETVDDHIRDGTGQWAIDSISSIDGLVHLLNHSTYNEIRKEKAKALRVNMINGVMTASSDTLVQGRRAT